MDITMEQTEAWSRHPIVKLADQMIGPEGSPLELLETCSALLDDLEERFPGMSYAEILALRRSKDKRRVARRLRVHGVSTDDITATVGEGYAEVSRDEFGVDEYRLAAQDLTLDELVARGMAVTKARTVRALRRDLTELDRQIIAMWTEQGEQIPTLEICRRLACTRPKVQTSLRKHGYRTWCEAQGIDPS